MLKIILNENLAGQTFSIYETNGLGVPTRFWNSENHEFTYDVNEASMFSYEDAKSVLRQLYKPRIERYQDYGENYTEMHIGDLYKKGML